MLRRPSASTSTRSGPSRRSTRCPATTCRSTGRSTLSGVVHMRAPTAWGLKRPSLWPTEPRDRSLTSGSAIGYTGRLGREKYRRYVTTEVLAHWESYKEAYRVRLEDGTELVASGDHRFWTRRGKWKHVTGSQHGPLQRPHLTLNDQLAGIGQFTEGPDTDAWIYRRGYLCGLIRGDGNLSVYDDARAERAGQKLHRFRLALADFEALRRAREYLADVDLYPEEFLFAAAAGAHREIRAIRDQSRAGLRADNRRHCLAEGQLRFVVQGVPGRHLRCGGLLRAGCVPDRELRPGNH